MKTIEVTPYRFSAKFGSEHIAAGSFTYYECDNGLGIVKDNVRQSIQLIHPPHIQISEISQEDEFTLLSMVCGNFKPDITIASTDILSDYEYREKSASRAYFATWIGIAVVLLACTLLALFLYSYLQA
ncbi:hypothetical protein [Paenibacillus sp. L3-i20]|uniref:hypothetical protein n=1 Tax=Paenibacillus sp. L3-i20 TaxID=2905833 RepID=UPI001EDF5557|nr:hypothetical protein [Paenibacillus sp. L3-i20]GKU77581.1 hypothetical protein L3i20_v219780 [Paenibacillus sp. L3-i20]